MNDLSTLYVELVASLTSSGCTEDAAQALVEASEALRGTEQEGRLTIAKGELAAVKGDYTTALALLSNVRPDHPYYIQVSNSFKILISLISFYSQVLHQEYRGLVSSSNHFFQFWYQ